VRGVCRRQQCNVQSHRRAAALVPVWCRRCARVTGVDTGATRARRVDVRSGGDVVECTAVPLDVLSCAWCDVLRAAVQRSDSVCRRTSTVCPNNAVSCGDGSARPTMRR